MSNVSEKELPWIMVAALGAVAGGGGMEISSRLPQRGPSGCANVMRIELRQDVARLKMPGERARWEDLSYERLAARLRSATAVRTSRKALAANRRQLSRSIDKPFLNSSMNVSAVPRSS